MVSNYFRDRVKALIKESDEPVNWFLWDAETVTELDSTAGKMLVELIAELKSKKVKFVITRLKGPIRYKMAQSYTLSEVLKTTPVFTTMGDALEAHSDHVLKHQKKK